MHLEGAIQVILGVDGGYIAVSQNVKWGREEVVRLSDIFPIFEPYFYFNLFLEGKFKLK